MNIIQSLKLNVSSHPLVKKKKNVWNCKIHSSTYVVFGCCANAWERQQHMGRKSIHSHSVELPILVWWWKAVFLFDSECVVLKYHVTYSWMWCEVYISGQYQLKGSLSIKSRQKLGPFCWIWFCLCIYPWIIISDDKTSTKCNHTLNNSQDLKALSKKKKNLGYHP